jgi:hypothetical protein
MDTPARGSFYAVLSEAIDDLMEHGFDSQERLDEWLRRLNEAARAMLVPRHVLERALRDGLQRVYERTVKDGSLLKAHKGISQYTLEAIKPKLRAELDRRILASASLIKLNREASIQRTLQRFAGWSTSIPVGGTDVALRGEVKQTIRRGIAGLSFEERRVVVDQSSKLVAAINEIVATDGGAIAGRWHHVAEGPPAYAARPDHVARNNKVYLLRDSWAKQRGLVKPGPAGYTDEITAPGEEVYCLPGDAKIDWFHDTEKAFRRWYDGPLVEIRTRSTRIFRATPNHPVLTSKGWMSIGALNEGDDVVEICDEGISSSELHANQAPPTFVDLFDAIWSRGFRQEVRDGMRPDFHGDGSDSQVDIVSVNGPLLFDSMAPLPEKCSEFALSTPDISGSCQGLFEKNRHGPLSTTHRITASLANAVRNGVIRNRKLARKLGRAFASFIPPSQFAGVERWHLLAMAESLSEVNETGITSLFQSGAADSQYRGDFINRLPFAAKTSDLISVNRYHFRGHVFNLQTASGWYVGNSIVTHNCRCQYQFLYNLRDLEPDMLTAAGKAELARVREAITRFQHG